MQVLVFSSNKEAPAWFARLGRSRAWPVAIHPPDQLQARVRSAEKGAVIYLDVSDTADASQALRYLARRRDVRFGIIDPGGSLKDVAAEFHAGAVDYLGPGLLAGGIDGPRLRRILGFRFIDGLPEPSAAPVVKKRAARGALSGTDWRAVRSGQEYRFTMMFIELDNQDVLRREYGAESLAAFVGKFFAHVDSIMAPLSGRRWIWDEFGGLFLLPFDGKRCDAVLACVRLMLNRKLASIEMFDFDILPSYRVVLHIGSTVYRSRGQTGNIVADSVNSLFHLGQKFARPGNLYLSEDVVPFVPKGLADLFVRAGSFEGREIHRLRCLL